MLMFIQFTGLLSFWAGKLVLGFPAQRPAEIVAIFGQWELIMILLPRALPFLWAWRADHDTLAQCGAFPLGRVTVSSTYLPNIPGFSLLTLGRNALKRSILPNFIMFPPRWCEQ